MSALLALELSYLYSHGFWQRLSVGGSVGGSVTPETQELQVLQVIVVFSVICNMVYMPTAADMNPAGITPSLVFPHNVIPYGLRGR